LREAKPIAANHCAQRRAARCAAEVGRGEGVGEHRLERGSARSKRRAITYHQQGSRKTEFQKDQLRDSRIDRLRFQQRLNRQHKVGCSNQKEKEGEERSHIIRLSRSTSPSINGPAQVQGRPSISTIMDALGLARGWSSQACPSDRSDRR